MTAPTGKIVNEQVERIFALLERSTHEHWDANGDVIDHEAIRRDVEPRVLLELEAAESWGRAQERRELEAAGLLVPSDPQQRAAWLRRIQIEQGSGIAAMLPSPGAKPGDVFPDPRCSCPSRVSSIPVTEHRDGCEEFTPRPFFDEDEEAAEEVAAAFDAGQKGVTAPPAAALSLIIGQLHEAADKAMAAAHKAISQAIGVTFHDVHHATKPAVLPSAGAPGTNLEAGDEPEVWQYARIHDGEILLIDGTPSAQFSRFLRRRPLRPAGDWSPLPAACEDHQDCCDDHPCPPASPVQEEEGACPPGCRPGFADASCPEHGVQAFLQAFTPPPSGQGEEDAADVAAADAAVAEHEASGLPAIPAAEVWAELDPPAGQGEEDSRAEADHR